MSVEKALGLKLQLLTDFSSAAKAADSIGVVADGLERLKDLGNFSIPGLDQMNSKVQTIADRINKATQAFTNLGKATDQTAASATKAAANLNDTATATDKVTKGATAAATAVLRLGTSLTSLGDQTVIVDKIGQAFVGLSADILRARQELDDLEASMLRLQSINRPMLSGSRGGYAPAFMMPVGAIASASRNIGLPGSSYAALPPGYSSGYGPIPQPSSRSAATEAITAGEVMLMLPGGTDPNFNSRAWYANQRANNPGWDQNTGSGPPIGVPPGGFGGAGGFWNGPGSQQVIENLRMGSEGIYRFGNDLQSTGYAQAVNAAMLGGWMIPAVGGSANIEDLMFRNREAVLSAGGNGSQADYLNQSAMNTSANVGSNFQQTVGALYDFISASPEQLMKKFADDPAVQAALSEAYNRVAKMTVAGSSSQHQISMEEASLDVNNLIANLGMDTSTPQKYAAAVRDATNILINLKNRTSTQVDLAASSFRALGPIGASLGMDMDDIVGFVAAMAAGKIRGMPAGQGLKRLLSRQAIPVAKLQELQALATQLTGGRDTLSMFDSHGNTKSLAQFGGEIVDFEDRNRLSAKQRAGLEGELSGIYAIPQMSLFLKSIREMGGAAGFRKYGESFRTGQVNGMDATEGSYAARTQNNTQNQIDKTYNEILVTRQQIFKEMEPEILAVLKDVEGLTSWFSKLPAPVQETAVNALALTAALSAIGGISSIVIGNALKVVGAFGRFGAIAIDIGRVAASGEALEKLGPIGNAIGQSFNVIGNFLKGSLGTVIEWGANLVKLAASGELFEAAGAAIASFGELLLAIPVAGWIAAAVLAIGTFTVAWINDWGNIREKTAAVFTWIGQEIPKIPSQIGYALGRGVAFAVQFAKDFGQALYDLPGNLVKLWNSMVTTVTTEGPKWIAAGMDWLHNLWTGIENGFAKLGPLMVNAVKGLISLLDPMTWVHAGTAMADNFIKGVQQGYQDGQPKVKTSLQKIRDLHPGSEPKDSSSPLINMGQSGKAMVDNFLQGVTDETPHAVQVASASLGDVRSAIDSIISGKHPKGKAKTGSADTVINLKAGETVAKIEADAKVIEDALVRAGAAIHKKWIDIVQQNGQVTRVQGDPYAYRKAVAGGNDSALAQMAQDYEKRIKLFPQSFEQELKKLDGLLAQATSSHTISVIEGMIGTLVQQHKKAMDKIAQQTMTWANGADGASGKIAEMTRQFQAESDASQKFAETFTSYNDKLQTAIEERKDRELPTLKELIREREIELTQQKDLQAIYTKEIETRQQLEKELTLLQQKTDAINGTDKLSLQIKADLNKQIATIQQNITDLNTSLDQQSTELTQVNTQVGTYTQLVKQAADKSYQWSQVLSQAFTKAGQDATKALGDSINNSLQTTLQRVFNSNRGGLQGFFGTFFSSLFSSLFQSLVSPIINGIAKNITGGLSGAFGGLLGQSTSTASTTSNKPTQVQLVDSGGTDISKDVHDSIVATDKNTTGLSDVAPTLNDAIAAIDALGKTASPVNNSKASSGSNIDPTGGGNFSDTITKALNSKLGKTLSGIAGAFAGYMEATTPGSGIEGKFAGALGTYSSISSIPGFGQTPPGQAVAIGAAIFDLFSHQDNPAQMPDKYDTQQFGQEMANLEGAGFAPGVESTYIANGSPFTENATLAGQLGNEGELQYIAGYIQQVGVATATQQLGAQIVNELAGISPTGQAFDPGAIHNGNVLLANGQQVPWQALATAADGAVQSIQQLDQAAAQSALQQQQNAANLAASFTSLILGGPAGFSIPYLVTGGAAGGGSIIGGGTRQPIGPEPRRNPDPNPNPNPDPNPHQPPQPPQPNPPRNRMSIHVLENVTSIGAGVDMEGLKDAITTTIQNSIPQITNAVNNQNYNDSRLFGNYTSSVGTI